MYMAAAYFAKRQLPDNSCQAATEGRLGGGSYFFKQVATVLVSLGLVAIVHMFN
ncbi:hypothetical protein K435DRAFT_246459 [Dendrothele bispora CBS 962.96]|uniref:Uncharacterized protein n=1 Tax=Dendrothele bispora (strain CBS 962.96) TaxID=1314807 RepID=A0A4V4HEG0_DENBC|nr:hypothetical protein K435DRAFT_246459 [Dendrothele bispora CBS 962.96]